MSKNIHRGIIASLAASALVLSLAPTASANVVDGDGNPPVIVPQDPGAAAEVFRIAGADPIATSIRASQSRTDWGTGLTQTANLIWDCEAPIDLDGQPVVGKFKAGDKISVWRLAKVNNKLELIEVQCEAVVKLGPPVGRVLNIIVARSDGFSDALAAGPLADVLDAPILLNPSGSLDPRVKQEIERLAAPFGTVTVHLLGGTDALSNGVESSIRTAAGVDETRRHAGIDRYETAIEIATETANRNVIDSGADLDQVNAYVTTGADFPDALAAGAAAANNDGVVVLTAGTELDRRGFTEGFLVALRNLTINGAPNTPEVFAIGGPAATAAAQNDIRLAPDGAYVGSDRFETATITATKTFGAVPSNFALADGVSTYTDAVVAGAYIANLDGPLLLTRPGGLTPVTAQYLLANVDNGDRVFTFGGPYSLPLTLTQEVVALLEAKFAPDPDA